MTRAVPPILDAHHHFWNLSGPDGHYPWLQEAYNPDFFLGDYHGMLHDFEPAQYRAATAGYEVRGTVHVEAERARDEQLAETEYLTALHERTGLPSAVVGHVYFTQPDRDEVLAGHAANPLVRGIRSKPVTSSGPGESVAGTPGSMQDPAWRAGFEKLAAHGFSWDLRVPYWHLAEAAEVVAEHPEIPVVVNHCGLPLDRSDEGLAAWRTGMAALAANDHVTVKVSELGLPDGRWDRASNITVIRDTVRIFGFDRAMFASNLPVSGLSVTFAELVGIVLAALPEATDDQLAALFAGTAARFYRIVEPS